ncbi:RluA family pseudouridine synthase [bacterium]|nr:RluA family pseudouridine synthase [bacterium]
MAVMVFVVDDPSTGMRIDLFLSKNIPDTSRSAVVRALQSGKVRVQGKVISKAGFSVKGGDRVIFEPVPVVDTQICAEDIPISIVFEDDDLAIIDKPTGMVTHPAVGHHAGTLVNALLHHLDNLSGVGGVKRPGIVHRLDKETSGLLMVAKTDRAHRALSEKIQQRTVIRIYDVVAWGRMEDESLTVDTQLGRDPKDRKRFSVLSSGGKHAVTHFSRQKKFAEFTLLAAKLETGRTHQIRVHSRYIGLPVAGDRTYGRRNESAQMMKLGLVQPRRQLLHARSLEFIHPFTDKPMLFHSPWPGDYKNFVESLA